MSLYQRQKFYFCKICKNMVGVLRDSKVPLVCCSSEMIELVPNTVEAASEKHLPAVTVSGDSIKIQVGSVPHPMEEAHRIEFVYVETERGGQRKCLKAGDTPNISFSFLEDKPVAVYAYCNLHGMWKIDI